MLNVQRKKKSRSFSAHQLEHVPTCLENVDCYIVENCYLVVTRATTSRAVATNEAISSCCTAKEVVHDGKDIMESLILAQDERWRHA